MPGLPAKLKEIIDTLAGFDDPDDRTQILLDYAGKFREVPAQIATRPFPRENKIPACESDAYIWGLVAEDGSLQFHFAVENPSGISAKALAVILQQSLSGLKAEEVIHIDPDIVRQIFRQNISMGKGMGLMSMVEAVRQIAARNLSSRVSPD